MEIPYAELRSALRGKQGRDLAVAIVNAPFAYKVQMVMMGIGIVVLLVHDPADGQIHRIALSKTELAEGTVKISAKRFEDIDIPADDPDNIIAETVRSGEPQSTADWRYLFTPALTPEQARLNQAGGAIACSHVYPLLFKSGKGAMIFSFYKEPGKIGRLEHDFMDRYSKIVSEALDTGCSGIRTLFPA